MELEELERLVEDTLSEYRIYHSKCVEKRCVELAKIYKVSIEKAAKVGIIHDIAKEMSKDERTRYVIDNNMIIDDIEMNNTGLLHAKIAGNMCKKQFEFSPDMVEAVTYHTTGKPNMCLLSKILFVADATGEDRDWKDLEMVREMSERNLDEAVLYILELNIKKNIDKKRLIHPDGLLARNYILERMEELAIKT